MGNTRVICGVTIEETVPRWMKEQGVSGGWLTAEYSMLPYSTNTRKPRDITKGRLDGRSTEIQRLIGRSLRAVVDLEKLGPRTMWVDCDVLQADGGTRTAAITGASLAVAVACRKLVGGEKDRCAAHPQTGRGGQRRGLERGADSRFELRGRQSGDAWTSIWSRRKMASSSNSRARAKRRLFRTRQLSGMLVLGKKGHRRIDRRATRCSGQFDGEPS